MNVFVADINPDKRLMSLFVVIGGRFILCSWMPSKYPSKCRIEKIVRGKALDRVEFLAVAEAIPAAIGDQFSGKTIGQWMDLIGSSFQLDVELDAVVEGYLDA